ncbi:hypothetical protein HC251_05955 [Iamia sp. SCSIO 61187]|uniref:hypothetical protein n=1 Tax=Iamia sp. SCSIO 61187 TaxID=2722752 RepID=UPI001C6269A5|nr:hypothetical protein [Iamia sp. SCSIO 61187]QYG92025.1 hypothetical protein HC251_05955 [Iamia sp. SCSIO 61187]
MADPEAKGDRVLEPGARVEVRDGFEGLWHKGYLVVATGEDGTVTVERASDGSRLPRPLPREAVRRERRNSMWWI